VPVFKSTRSVAITRPAFKRRRAAPACQNDIVWRTERRSTIRLQGLHRARTLRPKPAGPRYQQSRLRLAAQTLINLAYESNAGRAATRRPASAIFRRRQGNNFFSPIHTASSRSRRTNVPRDGESSERQPRKAGGKAETRESPARQAHDRAGTFLSLDRSLGLVVTVKAACVSRDPPIPEVVSDDLFIVALGYSFRLG